MFVGATDPFPQGAPGTVFDPETGAFVSAPIAPGVTGDIPMSVTVTPPVPFYPPMSVPITPAVALTPSQQRAVQRATASNTRQTFAGMQKLMPYVLLGGAGLIIYMMISKRRGR